MIYTTPYFSVYFGDASDQLYPKDYLAYAEQAPLVEREPYARVCKQLNIDKLTFCHQVHGIDGYTATCTPSLYPTPFASKGDFLVTNQPMALGVMTADCLPVVLYDTKTHSVGIVHAGWRGMVSGIIEQAIIQMEQEFGSCRSGMQFVFGPAARACCYEVTAEFKEQLARYAWREEVFMLRDGKLFFDMTQCALRLLHEYGVDQKAVITTYNECTVCCVRYCSYRRDKERAGRQMTVVAARPQACAAI